MKEEDYTTLRRWIFYGDITELAKLTGITAQAAHKQLNPKLNKKNQLRPRPNVKFMNEAIKRATRNKDNANFNKIDSLK